MIELCYWVGCNFLWQSGCEKIIWARVFQCDALKECPHQNRHFVKLPAKKLQHFVLTW